MSVNAHYVKNNSESTHIIMIGQRIKHIRKESGLTQEDFAKSITGSRRQVVAWEKGEAQPSGIFLEKISLIYNVDREWLKTGKGNKYLGAGRALDQESIKEFFKRHPEFEFNQEEQQIIKYIRSMTDDEKLIVKDLIKFLATKGKKK